MVVNLEIGARLNKADQNLVVANFITNAALEEIKDEQKDESNRIVDGNMIKWEAFFDTLK